MEHSYSELEGWPQLCSVLHEHSLRLLQEEIDWLSAETQADYVPFDTAREALIRIRDTYQSRKDGCLLRTGYGMGWRDITGRWVETYWKDEAVQQGIRAALGKYPNQAIFPKTRRYATEGQSLGWLFLRKVDSPAPAPHQRPAPTLPEIPTQPQPYSDLLKDGSSVPAQCLGADPNQKFYTRFKLHIQDASLAQEVSIRYPESPVTGTWHYLKIKGKGRDMQYQYDKVWEL